MRFKNVVLVIVLLVAEIFTQRCVTNPSNPNTPDTTSHQFTWTVDTLGGPGSSLSDVAVLSPDNIWVVGYIAIPNPDTTPDAPRTLKYNAAHWDGNVWDYRNIAVGGEYPSYPQRAVLGFDTDDVWTATSAPYHWNGQQWRVFGTQNSSWAFNGYVTAIWGTSSSNLFFVGGNGSITHYNGTSFTEQTSGTTLPLWDVWGTPDGSRVWATGYSADYPDIGSVLLTIEPGGWRTLYHVEQPTDSLGYFYFGCTLEDTLYLTTNRGVWKQSLSTGQGILVPPNILGTGSWLLGRIRGWSWNDLLLQSSGGVYYHWNGASWRPVFDFRDFSTQDILFMDDFVLRKHWAILTGDASVGALVFFGNRP